MFAIRVGRKWLTLILIWRFITGNWLDGKTRTDARWFGRGRKSVATWYPNPSRWSMLPRAARAGIRLSATVGTVGSLLVWLLWPTVFRVAAWLTAGLLVGLLVWLAWQRWQQWETNRHVLVPLAHALVPVLDMPPGEIRRGMSIGQSHMRFPVPIHYTPSDGRMSELTRTVNQRISGDWTATLQLKRVPFYVSFTRRPEPRKSVEFAEVIDLIRGTDINHPILGLGTKDEIIKLDFSGEIAHLAASIGTGGGKSSFLRFLTAQFAYHGAESILVCDPKWVSLAGMEDTPGLRIVRHIEDIWEALAAERELMDKRYMELLSNPNADFPTRIVVLEEQNAFALESSIHWRNVRPAGAKALPEVWNDIGLLLLKARQVNIRLVAVYQRMTADACGGGTFRDQYGLKLLSRFGPQAWDTIVGTRPRPSSSVIPGRAISVMGGIQRTVQIPFVSVDDAMELVWEGERNRTGEIVLPNGYRVTVNDL